MNATSSAPESAPDLSLTAAHAAVVAALESARVTAKLACDAWDLGPETSADADALASAADAAASIVADLESCELAARTALYLSDEPCVYTLREGGSGYEETIVATSDADARRQAREWARKGDWEPCDRTWWHDVHVIDLLGECETVTVQIDPQEPGCCADDHDWQSPLSVVGGIAENPGVIGHGGGVIITEVCRHCGCYRETDTWAQRSDTGEQGLRSVAYRDADDESLAWISETREIGGVS